MKTNKKKAVKKTEILQCIFTENPRYKAGIKMTPRGIMVHSTGANNPNLRRYVQPDDGIIGKNINGNDWNRETQELCVHAFIGKDKDGRVRCVQTLPWNYRTYHCGSGRNGSGNSTHISFEICEDDLSSKEYFDAVYDTASSLCAYLCREYDIDVSDVICHSEGYELGIASGHADVMHWFPRFGKDMDMFRRDVKAKMEDEEMTQERFNEMIKTYFDGLADKEPSDWSEEAREWAEKNGYIRGDADGKKRYKSPSTREELVQLLYNILGNE